MADESLPQKRKRSLGANFWWILNSSLILFAWNAAFWVLLFGGVFFYVTFDIDWSGWFIQNSGAILLTYLLLLLLVYFVVGTLRGLVTGRAGQAVLVSSSACFFSGFAAFILLPIVFTLPDSEAMETGRYWAYYGVGLLLLGCQMVLAVLVAGGGGLIGSRFLHRQSIPGGAVLISESREGWNS